jgi:hypothetical protein
MFVEIERDAAWKIFQSLIKYCRTPSGIKQCECGKKFLGFSGLEDVGLENSPKDDIMQGFFLSETLKYLYLLFSPEDRFPFSEYVTHLS